MARIIKDIEAHVSAEFQSMGFRCHTSDVGAVTDTLEREGIEGDQPDLIDAFILGYATAKGWRS